MSQVTSDLISARVVGIARLDNYDRAVEVTKALKEGGLSAIEFTLTGSGAFQAVTKVRKEVSNIRVGVGSVRTAEQVIQAVDSGAEFLVTPAFVPAVVKEAAKLNIVSVIGALTPTEMLAALDCGANFLKVFPARSFGPSYLKDILAPLPDLKLIPTGGIDHTNAKAYLNAGAVAVAVGGSLVDGKCVAQGDFASLTERAKQMMAAVA